MCSQEVQTTMCSHSASVETGLIYCSHIQILILTQRVKITHKKLYSNLIKQQLQLFCCTVSVVYSFFLNYKFRQDKQFVQHTHTPQAHTLSLSQRFYELELI